MTQSPENTVVGKTYRAPAPRPALEPQNRLPGHDPRDRRMSDLSSPVRRFIQHMKSKGLSSFRWVSSQGYTQFTFADGSTMNLHDSDTEQLKAGKTALIWGSREKNHDG